MFSLIYFVMLLPFVILCLNILIIKLNIHIKDKVNNSGLTYKGQIVLYSLTCS